jgi:thiamine-phosphate pyrophosphorylase
VIIAITDPRYGLEHTLRTVAVVREALGDERFAVMYRDKSSPSDERARAMTALVATGARTIANGTPEEALRLRAYGVHLAGDAPDIAAARAVLGDDAWISIAAHDDAAVERAVAGGATAVLVSPIFDTPGKGPPRGVEALTRARAIARDRLRVIALGGVDSRRAASCARAGADGIAMIRAIFETADPRASALELTRDLTRDLTREFTDRP